MTTSSPNVPQPAGAADPDGQDHDETVDPLLRDKLEGALPEKQVRDDVDPAADLTETGAGPAETDSVEEDRKRTGAD